MLFFIAACFQFEFEKGGIHRYTEAMVPIWDMYPKGDTIVNYDKSGRAPITRDQRPVATNNAIYDVSCVTNLKSFIKQMFIKLLL